MKNVSVSRSLSLSLSHRHIHTHTLSSIPSPALSLDPSGNTGISLPLLSLMRSNPCFIPLALRTVSHGGPQIRFMEDPPSSLAPSRSPWQGQQDVRDPHSEIRARSKQNQKEAEGAAPGRSQPGLRPRLPAQYILHWLAEFPWRVLHHFRLLIWKMPLLVLPSASWSTAAESKPLVK